MTSTDPVAVAEAALAEVQEAERVAGEQLDAARKVADEAGAAVRACTDPSDAVLVPLLQARDLERARVEVLTRRHEEALGCVSAALDSVRLAQAAAAEEDLANLQAAANDAHDHLVAVVTQADRDIAAAHAAMREADRAARGARLRIAQLRGESDPPTITPVGWRGVRLEATTAAGALAYAAEALAKAKRAGWAGHDAAWRPEARPPEAA